MKRVAQLLAKSGLTITEIAYEVGFNNSKNFSRYFKVEFKVLTSLYKLDKKDQTGTPNNPEEQNSFKEETA